MKYNVLIVDDHFVVREGLKLILETSEHYQVIGEADNGKVAIQLIEELRPDVILMDLNMPIMNGIEAIEQLQAQNNTIPVVILTTYNEDDLMIKGLTIGAKGYLLKDTKREHLFRTLDSAIRGETLLQPEIMEIVFKAKHDTAPKKPTRNNLLPSLSDKEKIVLQAAAHGHRSKEIAFDMGIAERTVKAHLTNIYNKLGVDSRAQAVAIAVEQGLVHI
ncbi:response regulator transcription factor [Paenibacillus sp. PK4536]|uniref:Chemotaxis response regulator protein-glutamate methylesterase n=1 Tax=Paenibacillus nuruki TaxID=1886670 RepID=A0A1E3L583_9BACL|nr:MULTISPECIES: response regulator transcription factor [Paenibacillus]ODP28918.1 Chemotaxis response regulator protein-glutamate methylesterase [Paenibacillus nuruki]WIM38403.1 response regulator transcription factor [Paenibacillus sp. PK4536]